MSAGQATRAPTTLQVAPGAISAARGASAAIGEASNGGRSCELSNDAGGHRGDDATCLTSVDVWACNYKRKRESVEAFVRRFAKVRQGAGSGRGSASRWRDERLTKRVQHATEAAVLPDFAGRESGVALEHVAKRRGRREVQEQCDLLD